MKQKATIGYYYKRAFLPLILCTAVFAIFTLLTAARENLILSATAFGFNGRFFWCAYMFFAYKGFENLFDQQSVSRKIRFRALVGFLPFSVLVAVVNLLLCYGGILIDNRARQAENLSASLQAFRLIPDAEIPRHLFLGLTGGAENGSVGLLLVLGVLLCALSVMRGMLFGVLLARLFHKFPRRIAFLLAFGCTAIFAAVCILIACRSGVSDAYFWGAAAASFFFGNNGANATLSVLFADIYMLCLYLILLRLTDGSVHFKKPAYRRQITRAAIGCALILVCGIGNVLLCTPTLVNALERTKTMRIDQSGKPVTEYTYAPDNRAFQLLHLQAKLALPAYRTACLSALAQNYYLSNALETAAYADGAAIYDELLQTFENSIGSLSVDFPLLHPAAETFSATEPYAELYTQKAEILADACLYFSSHGEPARAKRAYSAVVQTDSFSGRRDILLWEAAINSITIYLDNEQDRLWAAEQIDVLADYLEPFGSDTAPERARLRRSAADLRGEEIPDSETVTDVADY